ncbi:MAG: VPLPA-CTERM sorting domain-containing protein [Pseudomonadota bacterium]
MSKVLGAIAGLATLAFASQASAATFVFDGNADGSPVDAPISNIAMDCGTIGQDFCTDNDALGFDYSKDGIAFNVVARLGDATTELIQDLVGPNQGLGALSEGGQTMDQINPGESILITFEDEVTLSDIWLNDGISQDCPGGGSEGPCGDVGISIDGGSVVSFTEFLAQGVLGDGGGAVLALVGTTFEFFALTANAGYSIEQFTVSDVPVPAALPLLISGIAGLGFAARRRKSA